ncbi:hypothetical protein R5R35_010983 [Gryllus longicercus]|uniref:DNA replication complex GINS protein PSF3 n=1 Tax=Gryllus longicercus TaxID=2509291 RepID=A0AAN9Z671_9ORTH|nr:DNA replication complex GINS protein PSF3 [Gryllus bimaculatus]
METRFKHSYCPNYFSLEDILATQERVLCKVEKSVHGLGCLDQSTENEDLVVGTTLQLPFWLAFPLSQTRVRVVSVELPKIYKEAFREVLTADASIVDLSKLGRYFYEFGSHLTKLNHRDSSAINTMLMNAFKDRLRVLIDWAQNLCTDISKVQRLDTLEKELYLEGFKARKELIAWLSEGSSKMCASEMVVNHKKRKRAVVDI